MEKSFWTLGIFVFGLFTIWLGVMVRMGKLRWLFFGGNFPIVAPVGAFLIAIPMGLGFITIGLMIVFPERDFFIPLAFFSLIGVVLSFWTPNWLMPNWMSWLMNNYEHVLDGMFDEVHKMGVKQWEQKTQTQAELVAWADEVARKNGWQRLP